MSAKTKAVSMKGILKIFNLLHHHLSNRPNGNSYNCDCSNNFYGSRWQFLHTIGNILMQKHFWFDNKFFGKTQEKICTFR